MTDTGGPAFPTEKFDNAMRSEPVGYHGMTLRDYFAAQIVCGIVSSADTLAAFAGAAKNMGHANGFLVTAQSAYKLADAMIEARK